MTEEEDYDARRKRLDNLINLELQAWAIQLELLQLIAKATGVYHDNKAQLVLERIEARLDSMTADEIP